MKDCNEAQLLIDKNTSTIKTDFNILIFLS
jgi:hypothetical protein